MRGDGYIRASETWAQDKSLIIDILILTALFFGLVLPGIALARRIFPEQDHEYIWIQGSVLGTASAIFLGFCAAYVRLDLFFFIWIACLGAGGYSLWKDRKNLLPVQKLDRTFWGVVALLILVGVSRMIPLLTNDFPLGFDPSFHCLLAQKAQLLNRTYDDWQPYSHVVRNYPLGHHFLLANLATISCVPIHRVFGILIPLFGVLTTAQVYLLGRDFGASRRIGLGAAYAYGMLAVYGSISYYAWGGLPNQIGMCFVIFSVHLICKHRLQSMRDVVLLGFLSAVISFTHHHVMIAAGGVFIILFVAYMLSGADGRKVAFRMMWGGVVATVLGGFYLFPYALRISEVKNTGIMRFIEPFFGPGLICQSLGYGFAALILMGMIVILVPRLKTSLDGQSNLFGNHVVVFALIGMFISGSYLYRIYARKVLGIDCVAFTASRFLTDAVPFLAVYAGVGLHYLFEKQRLIALGLCLVLPFSLWGTWKDMFNNSPRTDAQKVAYDFVLHHVPSQAVIMTQNRDQWAPYITGRRAMHIPIPISEPQDTPEYQRDVIARLRDPNHKLNKSYTLVCIGLVSAFKGYDEVLWRASDGWGVVLYELK